jgi:lipopolysaccharide export system protein LptA
LTSFASFSLVLFMALGSASALAEKADRDKPLNIEADSLVHDELKQISVFKGRAVLTKGTMVIRGERIEIRQDVDGYQFVLIQSEPGKRAFFRQKREGVDEYMEAEGLRIEQAEVRRYRGAVLADQMTGKRIVYNNLSDVFTIDGQLAGEAGKSSGTRVRATLAPRSTASDKK